MKKARVLMVTPNLRVSEGELSRMQPPLGLMIFAPMLIKDGHTVKILGNSKVVYRPDKPLPCGAHVWIETYDPVKVDGKLL